MAPENVLMAILEVFVMVKLMTRGDQRLADWVPPRLVPHVGVALGVLGDLFDGPSQRNEPLVAAGAPV